MKALNFIGINRNKKVESKWGKVLNGLLPFIVFAVAGALLFASLGGRVSFQFYGLTLEARMTVASRGATVFNLPPVGKVFIASHKTPLNLSLTLAGVDLDKMQELVKDGAARDEIKSRARQDLVPVGKDLIIRVLLLGALGGLAGVVLLRPGLRRRYFEGALVGAAAVAILLAATYFSYDEKAYLNPRYEGLLRAAPWMVGLAEEAVGRMDTLGGEVGLVASNLYTLFERVDNLEPMGSMSDSVRVLHLSDIHNNPVAYSLVRQVVQDFTPSLIIDTGDISDYGTPLETQLLDRLTGLGVPYYFVPGNHDSPAIIRALKQLPGISILEGGLVNTTFPGLTIMGIPDPGSTSAEISSPSEEVVKQLADQVRVSLAGSGGKPGILAVHNHRLARQLEGEAPVILFGHDHTLAVEERGGSIMVNAGSTGAAGVRGLVPREGVPFSMAILYLKQEEGQWSLVAVDGIKVSNLGEGFNLERKVFGMPRVEASLDVNGGEPQLKMVKN